MKRFLALIAAAGLAVGLYAAAAPGGQQAVTPRQFAALKKQVTTLQKDMKTVKSALSCIVITGAAEFGETPTAGYHYQQPDGTEVLTSAVDLTGQGEQPQFYLATVDSQCVQARGFHVARIAGGRLER
jgi:hypothetical protein